MNKPPFITGTTGIVPSDPIREAELAVIQAAYKWKEETLEVLDQDEPLLNAIKRLRLLKEKNALNEKII